MSKIARYQGNVRAFASDAQGMERTVFGGTNQADDLTSQITASFLRGWGIVGASEHPSLEDFNAAMYAMSQFIAYQHQMGVPEWHAQQEYHLGSICTYNGESYQSLQDANVGSPPPSAKWTPVLTSKNGLANLGLEETINLAKNAVPATRRVNSKPLSGDITLWASDVGAISADAVGEITDNGTMASAKTPGWWRVAVSNSDTVADFPTYPDGSKLYSYGYLFVEKIGEVWFQHYYAHMGANAKRQDWGTVPNTSRPWVIDYNTANKPSAGDVGALPIAGGRLNGSLGIGTDNALGGDSIVLGDNDTGLKQNGDGVLDIYANSAHVLSFISSLVESMVSLKVNGNAVATGEVQAGNGSSRMTNNGDIFGSVWGNSWLSIWINNNFVADVQLGAGTSVATWNNAGSWPNTPGYVVTSVWKDNQGENIDGIAYAPLQKRVGNQWYTVQGGTA
ncbi:phage tail protein [Salmonella enterica subsp. salamae]|nr:phage tail protein [Salmonella enterica subsp. salamae]